MRALGPGSVSSFLKVILDVFHFVLWISLGAVAIAIVAVLLLSFRPELLSGRLNIDSLRIAGPWIGPFFAAGLLVGDLYIAGAIVIVGRLRRIFRTLIAGDPFHPDNVRRLRIIGLTLALLELGRYAASAVSHLIAHLIPHSRIHLGGGINLTTWFAVLVIVVLAEVFKEGARLRGEAELTI
ncbi:MAG TPA: DUF2975 domain-containing protein [Caulobacteraceae bacterium]